MTKGTDTMSEQYSDADFREVDPPLMTVADAEQSVEHLVEQREALVAKVAEYDALVKRIAYAVHVQHDPEASRELETARDELVGLGHQVREVDAAISEARGHVVEAQRRVAVEADRMQAVDLRDELGQFVSAGNTLAEALDVMVEASQHLRESVTRMNQLGAQNPNHFQLVALASRAIKTALLKTPFARELVDALPPAERKDFRDVVRGWQRMLETNMIRPRLAAAQQHEATNNAEAVNEAAH